MKGGDAYERVQHIIIVDVLDTPTHKKRPLP